MDKKVFFASLLIILFLSINVSFAKKGGINLLDEVWATIQDLQDQITNIQLIPGPPGPQGPAGITGAGDVAFVYHDSGSGMRVLTTDGIVWKRATVIGWIPDHDSTSPPSNIDPPIPVSDIVQWEYTTLLDKDGNVWKFSNPDWGNLGTPN